MADRPGSANRSMPTLSVMMRMAEPWGYRAHNSNPCKNTRRYKTPPRERFLTADEMARLNAVLTRDEFHCPKEAAVIRLLMLTGCRVGEIVGLQWDWIKGRRIFLLDAKSGLRTVWLSCPGRDHGALHPPVRSIRCGCRRPSIYPHRRGRCRRDRHPGRHRSAPTARHAARP